MQSQAPCFANSVASIHNTQMPLLDHFRPPLSQRRHWDSFHGAWAEAMAQHLNQFLLPEHFVAEARVKLGGQVEIDVGTIAEEAISSAADGPGIDLPGGLCGQENYGLTADAVSTPQLSAWAI